MPVAPITTVKTIVETVDDVGSDVKIFTLVDPDRWGLPPHRPGSHIDLRLSNGLIRTYSLCNTPAEKYCYRVAVKRERGGRGGSIHLHDRVNSGCVIKTSLPRGNFNLIDRLESFIFVAGGIGVTAFLSVMASLTAAGRPNFTLHLVSRGEPPLVEMLRPYREGGQLVTHDTTVTRRPEISDLVGPVRHEIGIACCGPQSMIAAFEHATRKWPDNLVHVERFVPPNGAGDAGALRPYKLILARSNREISVNAGQSMLSALLDDGIEVPSSCGGGICGACKVDWLAGRPLHRDLVLSPKEREGSLMACVASSLDEHLVLNL